MLSLQRALKYNTGSNLLRRILLFHNHKKMPIESNWQQILLEYHSINVYYELIKNSTGPTGNGPMFYPRLVRYSSADPSVPTMLPPQARVPSTPSMLLSFKVKFVLYLSCEKNENKQKEVQFGSFLKTILSALHDH